MSHGESKYLEIKLSITVTCEEGIIEREGSKVVKEQTVTADLKEI